MNYLIDVGGYSEQITLEGLEVNAYGLVGRAMGLESILGEYGGYGRASSSGSSSSSSRDKIADIRNFLKGLGGYNIDEMKNLVEIEGVASEFINRVEVSEEKLDVYADRSDSSSEQAGGGRFGRAVKVLSDYGDGYKEITTLGELENGLDDFSGRVDNVEDELEVYLGYARVSKDKFGAVSNELEVLGGGLYNGIVAIEGLEEKTSNLIGRIEELEEGMKVYAGYEESEIDKYGALGIHLETRYGVITDTIVALESVYSDFADKVERLEGDLRIYAGYDEVGVDKYGAVKGHLEARYGMVNGLVADVIIAKDDFVSKVDELEVDLRVYAGYNEVGFDKYGAVKDHLDVRYGTVDGLVGDVVIAKDDFVSRMDGLEARLDEYLGYDGSGVDEDKYGGIIDRLEAVGGGEYDGLVLIGDAEDKASDLAGRVDNIEIVLGEYGGYLKASSSKNRFGGIEAFLGGRVEGYGSVGVIGSLEEKVLLGYSGSFAQRISDMEVKLKEYAGYEFTGNSDRLGGINSFLNDVGGYQEAVTLERLEGNAVAVDSADSNFSFVERVDDFENTLEIYGGYAYSSNGGDRVVQINGFLVAIGGYSLEGDLAGIDENVQDFKVKVEGFESELLEYAGFGVASTNRFGALRDELDELGYDYAGTGSVSGMRSVLDGFKNEVETLERDLKEYAGHLTPSVDRFGKLGETLKKVGCGCPLELTGIKTVSQMRDTIIELKNRVIGVESVMGRYAGYDVGSDRVDRLGKVENFLGDVWKEGYVNTGTIVGLEANLVEFKGSVEWVERDLGEYVGYVVDVDSANRMADVKTKLIAMGGYSVSEMVKLDGITSKKDNLAGRIETLESELEKYAGYIVKDYTLAVYDRNNNRFADAVRFISNVAGYSAGNVDELENRKDNMAGRIESVEGKLDDYGYERVDDYNILEEIIDKFLLDELGYGIAGLVQQAKEAGVLSDGTDAEERVALLEVLADLKLKAEAEVENQPSGGEDSTGNIEETNTVDEEMKDEVENSSDNDGSDQSGNNNGTDNSGGNNTVPSEPSPEELARRHREELKSKVPVYQDAISKVNLDTRPNDTLSGVEEVADDFDILMGKAEGFLSMYGYVIKSESKDRVEDVRSFLAGLGYDRYDMIQGVDMIGAVNDFGIRITKLQKELIDYGFEFNPESANYLADIETFVGGKVIVTKPMGVSNSNILAMADGGPNEIIHLPIYKSSLVINEILDRFYDEFKDEMKDKFVDSVTHAVNDEVKEDYRWLNSENGWYRGYLTKPDWPWEDPDLIEQRVGLVDYNGYKGNIVLSVDQVYSILDEDDPNLEPSLQAMVGSIKSDFNLYVQGEAGRIEGIVENQEKKRFDDQNNIWDDIWNGIVGFFVELFGGDSDLNIDVEVSDKIKDEVAEALEFYDSDRRVLSDNVYKFDLGAAEELMKGFGYVPLSGVSKEERWKDLQQYTMVLGYEERYGLSDVQKVLYDSGNANPLVMSVRAAIGNYNLRVTAIENYLVENGFSFTKDITSDKRVADLKTYLKVVGEYVGIELDEQSRLEDVEVAIEQLKEASLPQSDENVAGMSVGQVEGIAGKYGFAADTSLSESERWKKLGEFTLGLGYDKFFGISIDDVNKANSVLDLRKENAKNILNDFDGRMEGIKVKIAGLSVGGDVEDVYGDFGKIENYFGYSAKEGVDMSQRLSAVEVQIEAQKAVKEGATEMYQVSREEESGEGNWVSDVIEEATKVLAAVAAIVSPEDTVPLSDAMKDVLSSHYPPEELDKVRIKTNSPLGPYLAHGAVTIGNVLHFREENWMDDDSWDDPIKIVDISLMGHEVEHIVNQWDKHPLGHVGFAIQYVGEYVWNRTVGGMEHEEAYDNISFEREAKAKEEQLKKDLRKSDMDGDGLPDYLDPDDDNDEIDDVNEGFVSEDDGGECNSDNETCITI